MGLSRHSALRDLSREHHRFLIYAQDLKWAAKGRGKIKDVCQEYLDFYQTKGVSHYAREERGLLKEFEQIKSQHDEIRELTDQLDQKMQKVTDLTSIVSKLSRAIDDNVRFEERELFGQVQAQLPKEEQYAFLLKQTKLILKSYEHWFGKSLLPHETAEGHLVCELFFAPFVLASAGNEPSPILNYGNQQALQLWEVDWDKFTRTPGIQTAEADVREDRERLLREVQENGYIENYRGIRISSTGKRFQIQKAAVWNLLDEKGHYVGQAAKFSDFHPI